MMRSSTFWSACVCADYFICRANRATVHGRARACTPRKWLTCWSGATVRCSTTSVLCLMTVWSTSDTGMSLNPVRAATMPRPQNEIKAANCGQGRGLQGGGVRDAWPSMNKPSPHWHHRRSQQHALTATYRREPRMQVHHQCSNIKRDADEN